MRQKETAAKRGKAVNCYFRAADMERIRSLAAYVAAKGYRVTDSAVIAAALRVAKADARLLKAFEEVLALDGRKRIE